jgi:tetratricopeptide (TPR) repeat protein
MAFHAARSGLKEEAGRLYLDLAKRTLARHDYLDAELLYKNAIENLPDADDDAQIAAVRGRGLMRYRLGRHEDAGKDFDVALVRARKVGARLAEIELLLDQGIVLDYLMHYQTCTVLTAQAEELAKTESLPPRVTARLYMGMGRSHLRGDRPEPGCEMLKRAIEVAEPLGDDGYEAVSQSLMMIMPMLTALGKFDEALAVSERIAKYCAEHNDPWTLAGNLTNRGLLYFLLGRAEDLVSDYRVAIQIAREYGYTMVEALATKDLGEVLCYLGRPDEADPLARRAAEVYTMVQGEKSPRVAYSLVMLARTQAYRGDIEGARATLEILERTQAEIRTMPNPDEAKLPADGQAQLDGVSLWFRGASDEEFDALVTRAKAVPLQAADVIEIMEFKALSALRGGRRADGIRLLEEAYAEADKEAKIVCPRLRRQLDNVTALAS